MNKPEEIARKHIDTKLALAGWEVQTKENFNRKSSLGVACCEFCTEDKKFADYVLYVNGKIIGIIEAKKSDYTLSGVFAQSSHYANAIPKGAKTYQTPPPFIYESNGEEIYFCDLREQDYRSREIGYFHSPSSLLSLIGSTPLRNRLKQMPPLERGNLRECQYLAIKNLESSLAKGDERSLLQMATGSGKTYTACNISYRLLKYAHAKRILFLVDRKELGSQTLNEYENFKISNRSFSELHIITHITQNTIPQDCEIVIMTIQRLYSILTNKALTEEDEELESSQTLQGVIPKILYNKDIPFDFFDFIIVDECHRSIYGNWRAILDYFDSFIIGLTATPSKLTFGFFKSNLIYSYTYEQSVLDGVNVDFWAWKIQTDITQNGATLPPQSLIIKRDKRNREKIYEELDTELSYEGKDLDRSVLNRSQIRTILSEYKKLIYSQLFSERKSQNESKDLSYIPKTLIFAKDDHHAEEITLIAREVFGKGNTFAQKITHTNKHAKEAIRDFRINPEFRIAVTVDMIATGTDIKPLEVLIFMRNIKSSAYFEQMKGRGCRSIDDQALQEVTPNAKSKNKFYLIDCVGVLESVKTLSAPIIKGDRAKTPTLKKVIEDIAKGIITPQNSSTLSSKLSRIAQKMDKRDEAYLNSLLTELPPLSISAPLQGEFADTKESYHFSQPHNLYELSQQLYTLSTLLEEDTLLLPSTPTPLSQEEQKEQISDLITHPFNHASFRNALLHIAKSLYIYIDELNTDEVTLSQPLELNDQREDFESFIQEHKDSISALSILYDKKKTYLTQALLEELKRKLQESQIDVIKLWESYAREQGKKSTYKTLTDLISLVRLGYHQTQELYPFAENANRLYELYLGRLKNKGIHLSAEQRALLDRIKHCIITEGYFSQKDFGDYFYDEGGISYANRVLGDTLKLEVCLDELYEALVG